MTLSCALIVRNEAATLGALLESIRPHVDELVIVDTGSTDETPRIAQEYADKFEVFTGCNGPDGLIQNFSAARNHAMGLCTGEWFTWFDGDDVVEGAAALRGLCRAPSDADYFITVMPYDYEQDAAGRCTMIHQRERLVWPREKFHWQFPVHENLMPREPVQGNIVSAQSSAVIVRHRGNTKAREKGRNLRLLQRHFQEVGEHDLRTLFYLGCEYAVNGIPGEALRCLRLYVGRAKWTDEKCVAELMIARIYLGLGDLVSALEWATKAQLTKSWPAPFLLMSRIFYLWAIRGIDTDYNFRRCIGFGEIALACPGEDTVLLFNPLERSEIHCCLNVAYGKLGDFERCVWSCEQGLAAIPDEQSMRTNLALARGELTKRRIRDDVRTLVCDGQLTEPAIGIVEAVLSSDFARDTTPAPALASTGAGEPPRHGAVGLASDCAASEPPRPAHTPSLVEGPRDAGGLSIVIYVGHGVEPWTPKTIKTTGIGGSETMAWEMARRLVKLGHHVTVMGHGGDGMVFEGVVWTDAESWCPTSCDLLLVSRHGEAVRLPIERAATVLWLHDVHSGDSINRHTDQMIDEYWCLSQWHKGNVLATYPGLAEDKIWVTRNGIDPARFEGSEKRHPHRAVYSSSPDRGLELAVRLWPKVRERVPDAELHVFYGFEGWQAVGGQHPLGPPHLGARELRELCGRTPGVVFIGRVSQARLAREFMRARVWAYPTWFSETSCITAMEAQAAGLWVATSDLAALSETVRYGDLLEHNTFMGRMLASTSYCEEWVASVCYAMESPPLIADRNRRDLANSFSLDALAQQWDEHICALVDRMRRDVVQPYRRFAG